MAILTDHLTLMKTLLSEFDAALASNEWAVVVDAGFYAVFHGMEAMNALECRDAYSFADAADILDTILVDKGLGTEFAADYRYLFYFRRGALYGAHVPAQAQMAEYARRCCSCIARLQPQLAQAA